MNVRNMLAKVEKVPLHWCARHLGKRLFSLKNSSPLISFSFDDFPQSAHRIGGEILRRYNLRGTYYVTMNYASTISSVGACFSPDDLIKVIDEGHEVGCHTYNHCDAWNASVDDFKKSILENQRSLKKISPQYAMKTFAYPKGSATRQSKLIAEKYFLCCRGIYPGINYGLADLNLLFACPLYGKTATIESISQYIEKNKNFKGWLIFFTHDISENPSPFGCTKAYFEKVVVSSLNSSATILPIQEASIKAGIPDMNKEFSAILRSEK